MLPALFFLTLFCGGIIFTNYAVFVEGKMSEVLTPHNIPRATIVTRVMPEGERVVAVVLEYDAEINAGNLNLNMFSVKTKLEGKFVERSIKKVYANNNGELLPAPFTNQGRFLVLELNPKEPSAVTATFDPQRFLSKRLKLEYEIEQKVSIKSVDGKEIMPFSLITSEERHLIIDEFKALIYEDKDLGVILPYRFYVPKNIDKNKKYPLVVFLHGAGERGNDNFLHIAWYRGAVTFAEPGQQAEHPCFVLAPQCPADSSWTELLMRGNPFKPTKTLLAVANLIRKIISEENIDSNRIYLTGLSMGGFGTFALLIEHPELFAGAIPICGGADINNLERIRDIPLWIFHAEDDNLVSVEFSRSVVKRLVEIGGKVKYTEFLWGEMERMGYHPHASWIPVYDNEEVIDWLFEQRKR
ncbi:phospholipase/Carboxylesterase [Dictyoglomus turgidum DSM 6724]|uniref:Phospholipase/Carboxylesterase n=2 Tax=Dictyoglomaceae TaxID=203488 RepID=B8E1P3_DICTD|nr:phospholipase/Carboxylesterase [Dictyoglomus turgidum DSM 6724]HBU31713.1 phospholipase/carboxylesterase [Dictyoglomus sp.]